MSTLPYQAIFTVPSLQFLAELAAWLANFLRPGDVLALDGPLGAGKTTFSQLVGHSLGVQEPITSPTFVLMQEYNSGRLPLAHVDLYRLGEEKANSLADELLAVADEGRAVLLVEWACYGSFMEDLANFRIQLAYDPDQADSRVLTLQSQRPLPEIPEFVR